MHTISNGLTRVAHVQEWQHLPFEEAVLHVTLLQKGERTREILSALTQKGAILPVSVFLPYELAIDA